MQTMQVRPERQRHGRPGPAVYHPSQDWTTNITRAPAPNTREISSNNSKQWQPASCIELRGTNPSTLLFFCFFAPHRQPVAVHKVALYSSLVLQQSLLIILALALYTFSAYALKLLLPVLLHMLPLTMLPLLLLSLLRPPLQPLLRLLLLLQLPRVLQLPVLLPLLFRLLLLLLRLCMLLLSAFRVVLRQCLLLLSPILLRLRLTLLYALLLMTEWQPMLPVLLSLPVLLPT